MSGSAFPASDPPCLARRPWPVTHHVWLGFQEVEPQLLRRCAGEVNLVDASGSHQRVEGADALLARVAETPAVVLRSVQQIHEPARACREGTQSEGEPTGRRSRRNGTRGRYQVHEPARACREGTQSEGDPTGRRSRRNGTRGRCQVHEPARACREGTQREREPTGRRSRRNGTRGRCQCQITGRYLI